VRGADGHVLLGLDGGDDVAHPGAAGALQCGQQGALADHHEVGAARLVEQIVFDSDDLVIAAAQYPAAGDPHRIGGGCAIEGLGGGCAPVDHQRLVVVVAHAEASDVALVLVVDEVQAPEDQAFVFGIQDGEPFGGLVGEGVALEQSGAVFFAHPIGAIGQVFGAALGLHVACCRGR